jgi:hypothetical protein
VLHRPRQRNWAPKAERAQSMEVGEQLSKTTFFMPRFCPGFRLHIGDIVSGEDEDRIKISNSDDPKAVVQI